MQEKILFLNKLQVSYSIKGSLYKEIRKALNYDNRTTMVGLDTFIESLPPHLNQAVTLAIHNDTFRQHPLFKKLKNKKLLAYIGSHLRPQFNSSGDLIYR